jgi:hypothetical protein
MEELLMWQIFGKNLLCSWEKKANLGAQMIKSEII